MRPADPVMADLSFLMRVDFCLVYFIAALIGVGWGVKKQSLVLAVLSAAAGIIFGLIIVASVLLVNGLN